MMKRFALAFAAVKTKLTSPASALRQVSLVAGGTVVAQLLNVATLPLLSRIYSPADFGVMAVYASVVAILTEIAGLRYHLAIPLPKQTRYAQALACLSFMIQIAMVSLISVVLFLAGDAILKKLSFDELVKYKYLLPIGLLTIGSYNIASQWAIRESLFTALGKTKVSQAASGSAAKIILGYIGLRPLGLLIGTIIGQAGGAGTLISAIIKKRRIATTKSEIKRAMIRYRKFPMYSTPFGLLNTCGSNMPQLFISAFFSVKVTGLYSMASMLLHIPSAFIGQALGQVFLQRASTAKHAGNLDMVAFKAYSILWKFACFPFMLIAVLAPQIFSFALGERWAEAGKFSILLTPWLTTAFVFSPMSSMFSVQERQVFALLTEILYFTLRLSALYVGALYRSPSIALLLYSLIGTCVLLFRLVYILRTLSISIWRAILVPAKEIAIALLLMAIPFIFLVAGMGVIAMLCAMPMAFIYSAFLYRFLKKTQIL